jgi:geranylgeranyl reductase family protein
MTDVVIAGAGPAGAIAATLLARAGVRVLVLDRARFPRPKLCGDTINPGTYAILRRLGLEAVTARAMPIDGMILTGAGNVRIEGRYGDACGYSISRTDLDLALVTAAAGAGARIEQETLVDGPIVDTSRGASVAGVIVKGRSGKPLRLPARVTIAADGRYSRVARAVGLSRSPWRPRRWAIGSYFQDVGSMSAFGEMHVRRGHYLGVAPLPGGITNACVVTPAPGRQKPDTILMDALRQDPLLRERFTNARMVVEPISLGPLAVDCCSGGMPGLLLAGDAAGFVDPMTGDGLRFAMRGAELAALEALHALEHGNADAHVRLLAARRREFAAKWRFNRTMRWMVEDRRTLRLAEIGAGLVPSMFRQAIRYAGDVQAA